MELHELATLLDLRRLTPTPDPRGDEGVYGDGTADITQGYASDLLSDVLANAPAGGVLITLQVHLNVIAVASHAGLRAVIFSCGRIPDDDVVEKAAEEDLSLFVSSSDTFEIVGRLYELGLRGSTA
ncbi:MAG: serine kinase [Thermoleophilia bacterium]|nr:serine kinase [Thermoleophilia bacterium]